MTPKKNESTTEASKSDSKSTRVPPNSVHCASSIHVNLPVKKVIFLETNFYMLRFRLLFIRSCCSALSIISIVSARLKASSVWSECCWEVWKQIRPWTSLTVLPFLSMKTTKIRTPGFWTWTIWKLCTECSSRLQPKRRSSDGITLVRSCARLVNSVSVSVSIISI